MRAEYDDMSSERRLKNKDTQHARAFSGTGRRVPSLPVSAIELDAVTTAPSHSVTVNTDFVYKEVPSAMRTLNVSPGFIVHLVPIVNTHDVPEAPGTCATVTSLGATPRASSFETAPSRRDFVTTSLNSATATATFAPCPSRFAFNSFTLPVIGLSFVQIQIVEQMPHLVLLCLQIKEVLVVRFYLDGNAFHDLESEPGKAFDLLRIVREEANFAHADIREDLRTDAVAPEIRLDPELAVRLDGVESLLLQFVSAELIAKSDAASFLPAQVKEHAAVFADELHRGGKLFAAIAALGAEDIAREAFAMDAHVDGLREIGISRDPCNMLRIIRDTAVAVDLERSVLGRNRRGRDALHEFFTGKPVCDEIADGNELDSEFFRDLLKLRKARHGAVRIHDFNERGRGAESGELRKVHRGFGVTGAAEHAFFLGVQRGNVTGTAERAGNGLRIRKRENRRGAVRCGNARGAALDLVHHDGERRAEGGGIVFRLAREAELAAAGFRERRAEDSAAFLEHKVHLIRRNLLRRDDEVAFVLAVLVIHDDKEFTFAEIIDGVFDLT